jgi:hypothetical protein
LDILLTKSKYSDLGLILNGFGVSASICSGFSLKYSNVLIQISTQVELIPPLTFKTKII